MPRGCLKLADFSDDNLGKELDLRHVSENSRSCEERSNQHFGVMSDE